MAAEIEVDDVDRDPPAARGGRSHECRWLRLQDFIEIKMIIGITYRIDKTSRGVSSYRSGHPVCNKLYLM